MHSPGKQHSHTDMLSRCASQPCKRNTCPECASLIHQVSHEEDKVRLVIPSDPYLEHFDGYLELVEDDSSLFGDQPTLVATPEQEPISPELLWYMSHHLNEEGEPEKVLNQLPDPPGVPEPPSGGCPIGIEQLLGMPSRQASTQTESVNTHNSEHDSEDTYQDGNEDGLSSLPDPVNNGYRVRAMGEAKKVSPAL